MLFNHGVDAVGLPSVEDWMNRDSRGTSRLLSPITPISSSSRHAPRSLGRSLNQNGHHYQVQWLNGEENEQRSDSLVVAGLRTTRSNYVMTGSHFRVERGVVGEAETRNSLEQMGSVPAKVWSIETFDGERLADTEPGHYRKPQSDQPTQPSEVEYSLTINGFSDNAEG